MSLVNELAVKCTPSFSEEMLDTVDDKAEDITILLSEVCSRLASVHKIEPRVNVEFLLQLVGAYKIIIAEGSPLPDNTPYHIISRDILPHLSTIIEEVEYNEEGFDTSDLTGQATAKVS